MSPDTVGGDSIDGDKIAGDKVLGDKVVITDVAGNVYVQPRLSDKAAAGILLKTSLFWNTNHSGLHQKPNS